MDIPLKLGRIGEMPMNWYEIIEPEIREVVRLLRNGGFNTTSSCGHQMTVQCEWDDDEDVTRLHDVLVLGGYPRFRLECHWDHSAVEQRFIEVYVIR